MSLTPKRTRTAPACNFCAAAFPARRFIAQVLAFMLLAQTLAPPALAAPARAFSLASLGSHAASLAAVLGKLGVGARSASAPTVAVTPSTEDFGVVLTPLSTTFAGHVGIEHQQPLRKVVVSSHTPTGVPLNFETLDVDGTHRQYSNVSGLTDGLKIATARDDGTGISRGGFMSGELFSGTGSPGVIARVASDGASVQNPWVTLAGEGGQLGGLFVDRTGAFGGDLVAVTTTGGVWRINSAGVAARIADLGTHLEGVTTLPDDVNRYGPWAGKILAGAKDQGSVFAIDAEGSSTGYQLGLDPEEIRVIPAHENFYGVDPAGGKIWGAPADAFAGIIGDILVAQGSPGVLARVRWNGTEFEVGQIAAVSSWEQITFSPAALSEIGGVKQTYDRIAVVRHAPVIDSGRVEGALWQLLPENVTLDGTDVITSDLLLPGTPTVTLGDGKPSFGGIIEGVESSQPTGYSVSISNNAVLRHVVTRTNPISLMPVPSPPAPAGTRDVSLSKADESIGNAATVRHLSISGKAGAVAVPPGAYGKFTANGHTQFVFGVEGASIPSVYDLEDLSLSGGSELRLVGPVKLNVRGNVSLSGSTAGAADNPQRLLLSVAQGAVGVTGNGVLYGIVRIPQGTVSIGGNGRIRGTVTCDRLNIYGNGVLQITESDVASPPVNRPPTADAGPGQTITLPTDVVSLNGTATDDGLPSGSTLVTTWTKVSGPGSVSFSAPGSTVTTAVFNEPGSYVLRLSASDSLLTVSDEMTVEVVPRNQPPVVNAGPDQSIELPNGATLSGTVTDDALPRGSTVTKTWTVTSGPGEVVFADPHHLATHVTFAAPGTYILRITADDTELSVSDEMLIMVYPENQAPVVNAGHDQTLNLPNAATLNGSATDDGWPSGGTLTTTWTKISGPGAVAFATSATPVTDVTFGEPGTYVLRLTGDDTRLSAFDEVTILVRPKPPAMRVYTLDGDFAEGELINVTHSTPDQLQLASTTPANSGVWSVVFDSQLAGTEWGRIGWTAQTCGDGLLSVSVATSEDNAAYTPLLVVSNGDDPAVTNGRFIKITVAFESASSGESPVLFDLSVGTLGVTFDTPENVAPGVDAGPDQTLRDTTTTALRGSVCDDALPSNQRLSMIWSQVSGPGTATFVNPNALATDVTFSAPGVYRLRMTASDSVHTHSDTLVVNVIPGNQPPVVNAGIDHSIELSAHASLSGTVTDDGFPSGGTLTTTWSKLSGPGLVTFGQAHQPSTTASFAVAGDYVLRLEATDSEKGAFDDVMVTVLPNPNRPPDIISEPASEFSLGPAPTGAGELVNLAPWTVKQYELNSQSNANWVKDVANNTVTQIVNADASILLSDFDLSRAQMDGTWRVNTTSDDDFIGFVFGYQNSEHFYLFDWKKGSQNGDGFAERGMSVKVVNADSALTGRDFWPTAGNGTRVRTLYHNTVPWQSFVDYQFTLQFQPGEIKINVRQGATTLGDITVNDATYTNGLFGFYNYSQAQVKYSGFRRLALAQGTYTYDVAASDPDGDGLAYSLNAAPSGMTIDAATGLISWPVTTRNAGSHTVTVRAQDPHGAFDTQSYTLTILNQNRPPVVSAGDDRTISVNATAALNGSVADDGLPRHASVNSSWSMASGPGLVAFADPSAPSTTATFSEAGTYVLRLTATDTALTASDESIITITPPNQEPFVNAGDDQTISQPGTARLSGTASDDGLPLGSTLAVHWSQVSGPGTSTFANPVSASTVATFTEPGLYVLRLTVSDTELLRTDEVSVTVNPPAPNQAPVVNAGAEQTVALNANLVRNAGSDEQLVGGEIGAWTEAVGSLWTRGLSGAGVFPESVNGDGFFYAGEAVSAELRQDVDVSGYAATIAAGTQSFEWKASVRSRAESVPDSARVIVEYRNQSNTAAIAWVDTGEVSSVDAWRHLENTRPAPAETGWIRFRLIATRRTGTTNDAYFDALSLRAVTGAGVKLSGTVTDDGLPASGTLTTSWSKLSGPGTVTFAGASTARTTATFSEAGVYILRLSANDSELTGSDELAIKVEPRNLVPVNEAGADQTVTLPATASLNGTAHDDGRPIGAALTSRWIKVSGPGAVTFADASALITTASFGAEGTYVLGLTTDDTEYSASDTVTVTVHPVPPNSAPLVNAGADQLLNPPATSAALSGTVSDDGRPPDSPLTYVWTKVSGPGTVDFSNPAALLTTATFSEAGVYILRLTADDTELTGSDDVRVTLAGTNKAPVVNAGTDRTAAHPTTFTLLGAATDDGLPAASTLSFNWAKVNGPGAVTFANAASLQTTATFSTPGVYALRLTASDTELTGADEVTITLTPPPTVSISSPAEGATLTSRTSFIGTVSEGSTWRLEHSLNEEGSAPVWTTFASGSTPVTNSVLGTFDPTLLLNGIYTVRLVATSAAGQTAIRSATVVVDGGQKVGNFSVSFSDLNVPLAGTPIEVVRTYDSRDKRVGDFGVGWTLDVRNIRLQESVAVGVGWQATVTPGFMPNYCLQPTRSHAVSITMPDNEVLRFEAVPSPQCSLLYPLGETTIRYRAMPGTHATLAPVGDASVLVNASFPGEAELLDYRTFDEKDFDQYRLTLAGGAVFIIDQRTGLREATDTNGNKLTISHNGITHSSGKSIAFTRDAQGRITRITDPAGNAMTYDYDAKGDLVGYRDRENNVVSFTYNTTHELLSISDPRGLQPIRNEYDGEGRLLRHTDAAGNIITYTHDLAGRRERTTDRLGRLTTSEYDDRGNVVRSVDTEGGVTSSVYDASDNLLKHTDPLGQATTFTYDARGNRTSITDPLGQTTRHTYSPLGQPLTITDALGQVTTITYDAAGNPLTIKDPQGNKTSFSYNPLNGQPTAVTDAAGHVTRFKYDAAGNLSERTDAQGVVTTFAYDINGRRTAQAVTRTLPNGLTETLTTTQEYDRLDRVVKTTLPDGSSARVVYNAIGQQIATIDQLGRQTSFTYNETGELIETTYPDGLKESATFDAEGRRLTSTDRAGRVTRYTHDALDRTTRVTHPDGTWTSTTVDASGQTVGVTDARGNMTRYEYDAAGRRTKITGAGGGSMTMSYNAAGQQTAQTDAHGAVTRFEYDVAGRRTKVVYPDSTSTATAYDVLGRAVAKTDQAGRTVLSSYDALGRLVQVTNALGHVTRYNYDVLGRMVSQTDANNHTTRFEYDRAGRRARRTLPLGMSETYAYDNAGNLLRRTDFNGKTTAYAYDVLNRLSSKTPDPSLNQSPVTYTYTATGRRASMADASGTTVYTYDDMDRLTSKTTPAGRLTYTYDAAGNLLDTRSSNPNGVSVAYSYDTLNRLSAVSDNRLPGGAGSTTYTYDGVGNLQSYAYPNGVRTAFGYNSLNRLTAMTVGNASSTLASYSYTLGSTGHRLAVTELGGRTVQYQYDALYRLKGETITGDPHAADGALTYDYDAVGNRLARASTLPTLPNQSFTYDASDRPTDTTFDANGNTVAANGNTYRFDWENRLTGVNNGAVTFLYDGDGQRVGKRVGATTIKYLVDTNNPTGFAQVVDELTDGAVTRSYTYGHSLISQRQLVGGAWQASFYGYDGHGNVRLLTDAAGTVTDTYSYDAFGNLLTRTGSTPNERLYTGEQLDADIGFYYLRARYLDPTSGRFWTLDSYEGESSDPRSLHKYLYAFADPVNRVDPSGNASVNEYILASSVRLYLGVMHLMTRPAVMAGVFALSMMSFLHDPEQFFASMVFGGPLAPAGGFMVGSVRNMWRAFRTPPPAGNVVTLTWNGKGNLNQFWIKALRLRDEAARGGLGVINGTDAIRDATMQAAYRRKAITIRANQLSRYGDMSKAAARAQATKEFSTMHADHMIELQVSHGFSNPNSFDNLWMLDGSTNLSFGAQIHAQILNKGLKTGDIISDVIINAPPLPLP